LLIVLFLLATGCGGTAVTTPAASTQTPAAGQPGVTAPAGSPGQLGASPAAPAPAAPSSVAPAPAAPAASFVPTTLRIGGDQATNHGTAFVQGKPDSDLDLSDNYFDPTVLVGSPGQTLQLKLKNKGTAQHNFSLPAANINQDLAPGQEATVSVTFPPSGVTEFYCRFHRSVGMVGGLAGQ
jgi:plastocyanin